jgi:hypothetical protein
MKSFRGEREILNLDPFIGPRSTTVSRRSVSLPLVCILVLERRGKTPTSIDVDKKQ